MTSCLVIGPASSGKTALIKRLQDYADDPKSVDTRRMPVTQPTIGINMPKLGMGKNRNREITLREIGGAMAPLWPTYFAASKCVMFVIDMSNQQQLSAASIQLSEMLANSQLSNSSRVLVVLSKFDAASRMDRAACQHIIRLNDIMKCSNREVYVQEASALDGSGIEQLYKWLDEATSPQKRA